MPTFKYSETYDPLAELVKINPIPSLLVGLQSLSVAVVNEATSKLVGYSEQELLAMSLVDLVPLEDVAAVHHAAEEPVPEGETLWRCVRKDGTQLYLKLKYRETMYQGQAARFIVVLESSLKPFDPEP
ncbi:MAG TPA: PAS domain-containing protein [Candidatus Solibacter sp.]|jgi:PAS domain S-box-containing protein|nr:PAS domain-containing protein [Candidatus Solibacter sp.]